MKFFEPNASNLVAVVQCLAPTDNGAAVLAALIVTSLGSETHITLEQISGP